MSDLITRATIEGNDKFGTGQNGAKYRIKILQKRKAFISRWTTNAGSGGSNTDQVQLPLINGKTYNMLVDWGDGTSDTITAYNQAETLHTYSSVGTYTITMTGTNGGLRFANGGDKAKINQISQWGTLDISAGQCFQGCGNLDVIATDAPIISTNDLRTTFQVCSSLIGGCDNWDMSNADNLGGMFRDSPNFNGDISNWDVSNATGFSQIFMRCTSFNQPIGKWDVSSAVNLSTFLSRCSSFNQDLGNWDVSNCIFLNSVFEFTNFDLSFVENWNVTSACNTIRGMFKSAGNNLGNLTLSHWDVSNVTNFQDTFVTTNFNGDISGWDVGSGTNFKSMFNNSSFNQDIGSWDMSSATNIATMLRNTPFDQDISGWDITNVTNMTNFLFQNTAFSTANYDALLVGWEAQTPQSNINVHFGDAQYTSGSAAETARTSLINTYNWTITDGGAV